MWSSATIRALVRGFGPGSLLPNPARSYAQTRVSLRTPGVTHSQVESVSPAPASRITAGDPSPSQRRFNLKPPTSMRCAARAGRPVDTSQTLNAAAAATTRMNSCYLSRPFALLSNLDEGFSHAPEDHGHRGWFRRRARGDGLRHERAR